MRDTKQEITHFWFEETEPQLWFQNNPQFDERVRERYAGTYELAKDGLCDNWSVDAEGCLALCIVLGEFPRRLYRGAAAEFATDEKALLVAKKALNKGFDQLLTHEKRFFMYIPFERSEIFSDQKRNLDLFKSMEEENPLAYRTAKRHFAVIEKIGRFPQRNKVLGRENTPEEEEWLKENGGQ